MNKSHLLELLINLNTVLSKVTDELGIPAEELGENHTIIQMLEAEIEKSSE